MCEMDGYMADEELRHMLSVNLCIIVDSALSDDSRTQVRN